MRLVTQKISVTCKIVPENDMKPKNRSVRRNMLLNFDDLLDHFRWNLGETKITENTKPPNEDVANLHEKEARKC